MSAVQQAEITASIQPPLGTFLRILSLYRNHLASTYRRGQVLRRVLGDEK